MNGILVDSNILLDVFLDDPKWGTWSEEQLGVYGASHHLYINPMIYAEISIGFSRMEDLEQTLMEGGFNILPTTDSQRSPFFSRENLSPEPKTEGNETISPSGFFHRSPCGD